jgi:hypothetical protein
MSFPKSWWCRNAAAAEKKAEKNQRLHAVQKL